MLPQVEARALGPGHPVLGNGLPRLPDLYGKYGYPASAAGEFMAHHVLAARPLYYHSFPNHLYWTEPHAAGRPSDPRACFTRTDNGWAEGLHPVDAFRRTRTRCSARSTRRPRMSG